MPPCGPSNELSNSISQRATTHYNLGLVYSYRDSAHRAERAYLAALQVDSTLAPAHKKLGLYYRRQWSLRPSPKPSATRRAVRTRRRRSAFPSRLAAPRSRTLRPSRRSHRAGRRTQPLFSASPLQSVATLPAHRAARARRKGPSALGNPPPTPPGHRLGANPRLLGEQ